MELNKYSKLTTRVRIVEHGDSKFKSVGRIIYTINSWSLSYYQILFKDGSQGMYSRSSIKFLQPYWPTIEKRIYKKLNQWN